MLPEDVRQRVGAGGIGDVEDGEVLGDVVVDRGGGHGEVQEGALEGYAGGRGAGDVAGLC